MIESLLPGLAGADKFGFGSRQRYIVLTAALPRNRSAVHHEDVTGVYGHEESKMEFYHCHGGGRLLVDLLDAHVQKGTTMEP